MSPPQPTGPTAVLREQQLDAQASYNLRFGDRRITLLADAFNLFNHPGFGFPNQNFDSPTAGRITIDGQDIRERRDLVAAGAEHGVSHHGRESTALRSGFRSRWAAAAVREAPVLG
jgi:hypothetical protein